MNKTALGSKEGLGLPDRSRLPLDVVSALGTLQEFITAGTSLPPQVIATCRGQSRAFGRGALEVMSYRASLYFGGRGTVEEQAN